MHRLYCILSDVDVNNNSKSSKKKGSTNLTLNDLKMLAMTIRSDIEKKFIESLQERSMIKKDIVGEICDKVTQRFVYGEKNVQTRQLLTKLQNNE